jgi:acetyl esterase/lipase
MRTDANLNTPFFQAHGKDDVVVDIKFGEMTCAALKKLGINVEFHKYESMGHEANPEELDQLREWIDKIIVPREAVKKDATPQSKEKLPGEEAVDEGNPPRGKV